MNTPAVLGQTPGLQGSSNGSGEQPAIVLRNVTKQFSVGQSRVLAMDEVSLEIPSGCFFTLLGSSGSGKTTTLRCIAGLEDATSGEIEIAGRTVFSSERRIRVPSHRRNIGMVFQSYALWPHMTVFQNVAYPLESRRVSSDEIKRRVLAVLENVGLSEKVQTPAPNLSGGQQQRVALARALVLEPSILLLDEPLSNLDARLRDEMRRDLLVLQKRLRITTLYVTHDQDEALALSDAIGVMSQGRIVEMDSPVKIYYEPHSAVTAGFVGVTNAIQGQVVGREPTGHVLVKTGAGVLASRSADSLHDGQEVVVFVRPERMSLHTDGAGSSRNNLPAVIEATSFLGSWSDYWLLAGGVRLRVRREFANAIEPGTSVIVTAEPDSCLAFPADQVPAAFVREEGP